MQEFARDVPRGKVQMRVSDVPFADLPGQSRLFLDYLSDPASLRPFYPNAVPEPHEVSDLVPQVIERYSTKRDVLCDALLEINAEAGEASLANIIKLRQADCVAVVTGQQAGLFTGPLYTIYKALSAVRMAADLTDRGIKAVPVFWVATEDHDLAEVSSTFVLNGSAGVDEIIYEGDLQASGRPVGNVVFGDDIGELSDRLFAAMGPTEFTAVIRTSVSSAYQSGASFGEAFIRLMAEVLKDTGMVFIDPMHPKVKELGSPLLISAIEKAEELTGALLERNAELRNAGYEPQVLIEPDHFPLFWIADDGRRLALRRDGEGFRVKGERKRFTTEELKAIGLDEPTRFSPAVMLRPVVQDFLLPTACYFGGGAEVAYFAQTAEVYRVLDRPVTPVFHRQSFTVVEPRARRAFEHLGLKFMDVFRGIDAITLKTAQKFDEKGLEARFDEAQTSVNAELDRLYKLLVSIDKTLAESLSKRGKKIAYHISALRKKALLASLRKDETTERRIAALFNGLMPGGVLQERKLNVLYFLNKYGPKFIDWIYDATDVNCKQHRIVELP